MPNPQKFRNGVLYNGIKQPAKRGASPARHKIKNIMEYENFNDVKVGDKVYVKNCNGGVLCEVKRVTKSQFMTLAITFRKSDGKMLGTRDGLYAIHATPEIIEKVRRVNEYFWRKDEFQKALQKLGSIGFCNIQSDDFVAIINIANKYKQ